MRRQLKLFKSGARLIVAFSVSGAQRLLREAIGESGDPRRVTKRVKLSSDAGETFQWYAPSEIAVGHPRIIPEAW